MMYATTYKIAENAPIAGRGAVLRGFNTPQCNCDALEGSVCSLICVLKAFVAVTAFVAHERHESGPAGRHGKPLTAEFKV